MASCPPSVPAAIAACASAKLIDSGRAPSAASVSVTIGTGCVRSRRPAISAGVVAAALTVASTRSPSGTMATTTTPALAAADATSSRTLPSLASVS